MKYVIVIAVALLLAGCVTAVERKVAPLPVYPKVSDPAPAAKAEPLAPLPLVPLACENGACPPGG